MIVASTYQLCRCHRRSCAPLLALKLKLFSIVFIIIIQLLLNFITIMVTFVMIIISRISASRSPLAMQEKILDWLSACLF